MIVKQKLKNKNKIKKITYSEFQVFYFTYIPIIFPLNFKKYKITQCWSALTRKIYNLVMMCKK